MKKSIFVALVVVAGAAVLFSYLRKDDETKWTTRSPEALQEFLLGQDARMRLYGDEARVHFVRAAELDNEFVAAKIMVLQFTPREEREPLKQEIKALGLERLEDHERFIAEYTLARNDGENEQAVTILDDFLSSHPKSPWGLVTKANLEWARVNLDQAETLYKELLEADPNWVTAQNNLGYIAMSRGDFSEAEDHFMTYQYIAPDQANPHDSRGELLTLVGRYEEAWDEFQTAIDIHPEFCASYGHQLTVGVLAGYQDRFPALQEATNANCQEEVSQRMDCAIELWSDYRAGRYDTWFEDREDDCVEALGSDSLLHRMAVLSGRPEAAQELESEFYSQIAEVEEIGLITKQHPSHGIKLRFEGVRLLATGDVELAAEKFRAADGYLSYMGHDVGILKLVNGLDLALALESTGDDSGSQQALKEVLSVNPRLSWIYDHWKQELATAWEASS